jgi:hypothetical protein
VQLQAQGGKDYFEVHFTPDQEGLYILQLENTHVKLVDTRGTMGVLRPSFYATASVVVGSRAGSAALNDNPIVVGAANDKKWSVNQPVVLNAVFKGNPLAKTTITVFSPAGWSKEITTDEKGVAGFIPGECIIRKVKGLPQWRETFVSLNQFIQISKRHREPGFEAHCHDLLQIIHAVEREVNLDF